jgi:hypothetical protein
VLTSEGGRRADLEIRNIRMLTLSIDLIRYRVADKIDLLIDVTLRHDSIGGGPRLERVPGRSEQARTSDVGGNHLHVWLSGPADDYITTKWSLQSPKSIGAGQSGLTQG